MRYLSILLLLPTAVVLAQSPAENPDPAAAAKAEIRARIEKYRDTAVAGVYYSEDVDVTKDGQILRVFAVGVSTISAVLGDEEGVEIAKERAEESAKGEFVKWLGSKVTLRKTTTNEILLTKEGVDGGDGATVKEAGKKVERRTKEFEETSSSLIRGMKVVAVHQDPKNKKFIIVYRWEAKSSDAAGKVSDKLNGNTKVEAKVEAKAETKKPEPKKSTTTLPEKKVIIDD